MKRRKRTSPIWTIPSEEFQNLLNTSKSIVDILIKVGLDPYNGNHKTINHRIREEGFNTIKFEENRKNNNNIHIKNLNKNNIILLDDILKENSTYSTNNLKKRLIGNNLLKKECLECGITDTWNNNPISLQLDHINGINNDNRLENLRILCPNCHSQTETFSGKHRKKLYFCIDCGEKIIKTSKRCNKCSIIENGKTQRKFEITKVELENLILKYPMTKVGKLLGVSDNAVRKRCTLLGIIFKSVRG